MYRKRFFRRPRRKIIRRRAYRGKRGSVSTKIKKYVKRAIHANIENKKRMDYAANTAITAGTFSTQCLRLLVPVGQGTSEIDRVGNQVKIVRGQLKIFYNLLDYDSVYNPNKPPVWVRVMVIRDLRQTFQSTGISDSTKLFAGNNGSLPLQNNMLDMCLPINTDYYRVLYQTTFKLGFASNLAGGYPTNNSHPDNSSFSKQLIINWGKWCKKQLKFDDNVNPYYPQNENLYLVHQAVYADGTSVSDAQKLAEFHYVNQVHFEDA